MNVVSKIKQVGYEIVLDGAKTIGYQHSCNLYVQLTMDPSSSSPFKDCVITAACSRWDSEMPDICPIEEIDNKKYILLTEDVFREDGIVRLSIGGISKDKVVVTSNMLELRIRESNSFESSISQSESYMEIRILTAMKVWYKEVVDPYFTASTKTLNDLIQQTKDHENTATQLQQNAQTQQGQVTTAINNAVKATSDANTAAANADAKAQAANTATTAANKAKSDADTAAGKANKAASDANTAASNANTKAGEAAAAASEANAARDSANTLTQTVQQKLANGDFNGRTMHNGIGDPPVVLGKDGDTYLNKSHEGQYSEWLYLKDGGKWIPLWKTKGNDGTDTVPVGAGYLISGDTVPPGYKETTPPFSNPNLLINGDFQVWQRGNEFNITSNRMYTADRWIAYMNASDGYVPYTITNSSRRMKISSTAGECKFLIFQHVELNNSIIRKFLGKKLTLSVKIISSNAQEISTSATILYNSSDKPSVLLARKTHTILVNKYTTIKMTFDVSDDADFDNVKSLQIIISSTGISSAVYIDYAKLELGEIATPYMPRPYAEESMLCQRYFQLLDVATPIMYEYGNDSSGYAYLIEPRFAKMRATPSIASDIHFNYYDGAGNNVSGICVSAQAYNGYLTARTSAGGARLQNHCFGVKIATTLDAEIY